MLFTVSPQWSYERYPI